MSKRLIALETPVIKLVRLSSLLNSFKSCDKSASDETIFFSPFTVVNSTLTLIPVAAFGNVIKTVLDC